MSSRPLKALAILGRGPTLAIAQEASLKLKEVCNIQAEAFSGAEFQHGPIALVSKNYPVLVFMPNDEAAPNLAKVAADISRKGGLVFVTGTDDALAGALPVLPADHPETDAVCLIQSFYALAVRLAGFAASTSINQDTFKKLLGPDEQIDAMRSCRRPYF